MIWLLNLLHQTLHVQSFNVFFYSILTHFIQKKWIGPAIVVLSPAMKGIVFDASVLIIQTQSFNCFLSKVLFTFDVSVLVDLLTFKLFAPFPNRSDMITCPFTSSIILFSLSGFLSVSVFICLSV